MFKLVLVLGKIESSEVMFALKNSKYYEIVSYLLIGVLTTVVYFIVRFSVFSLTEAGIISVIVAQIAAILFAFVTNKVIVFKNKAQSIREFFVQFVTFCLARGFVFMLDIGITLVTVELYSDFFITILRLNEINFGKGLFSWSVLSNYIGNAVNLNAFIFALITQVLAIIINYILSKYFVFKKSSTLCRGNT
ncbi:GtrA family protein [Enterococcus alcedinis]|uniref:GtrA family protein n=1 Tax=Enterococcus alcedinis TaxID=1274384 RepID=UPI0036235512